MGSALGNLVTNREKRKSNKARDRNVNNWRVVGDAKFGGGTHFYDAEEGKTRGIQGRKKIFN